MRDRELWRNGSGYVDPTAYEAMRNVLQEDCKMQRGEIWAANFNGTERPVLIIAAEESHTSFILLRDEPTEWDNTELISSTATIYYYNPRKLSYKIAYDYKRCISKVDEEQMAGILEKVREALDLCPVDMVSVQRARIGTLETENKRLHEALTELNARLEAEKAEHSQDLEDMQDQIDLVETDKKDSLDKLAEQSRLHNERMRLEHCSQIDALKAEAQDKIGALEKEHAAEIQQLRERCAVLNAERNLYHAEYKELLSTLLAR